MGAPGLSAEGDDPCTPTRGGKRDEPAWRDDPITRRDPITRPTLVMGEQLSDGDCILEERALAIKIRGPIGTKTEVGRFPAMVHAVKVMPASLKQAGPPSQLLPPAVVRCREAPLRLNCPGENHLKGPGQGRAACAGRGCAEPP